MRTRYHYGKEAMKYSVISIPKMLFVDDLFADLSIEAKVIYGLLLERMALSKKNDWIDENNRVFVIFPVDLIQEATGLSKRTIVEELGNLDEFGLIEMVKQGQGKPNLLYIKNFACKEA